MSNLAHFQSDIQVLAEACSEQWPLSSTRCCPQWVPWQGLCRVSALGLSALLGV